MSVHDELEKAVISLLEANGIGYGNVTQGPKTQPEVEGSELSASVRIVGARGERLRYGQTSFTDAILVTVWWRDSIGRADRIAQWELFRSALLADQYLGGAVVGLQDAYLARESWGEAKDGVFVIMAAEIETERIE